MSNKDNLKANWKKGESGNPNGRPKGSLNRSTIAKRWLEVEQDLKNPITGDTEKMSQEDLMTLALIKKAREGDGGSYQKLMDSAYGKAVETKEISVKEDRHIFSEDDLEDV